MAGLLQMGQRVIWPASILAGAIVLALVVHLILFTILKRVAQRKGTVLANSLVHRGEKPGRFIIPFLALLAALPAANLPDKVLTPLQRAVGLGLIAAVAWLVILFSEVTSDLVLVRYRVGLEDTPTSRRVHTQILVLHRIVITLVVVVALATMLMTFPTIKHIGMSLLASAGLAGLVVGMAMKDTLSNLIAGIEIAFTELIRLGDAVVVQNQYGWVEEIGTTYVVIRIWDLRRLVVPLSYFLSNSFENWTRSSTTDLLGAVTLNVDYSVPVEEVRKELNRLVRTTDKWKGGVCVLQVNDADAKTIQLQALVDARDSDKLGDLRAYLREKLIQFLQEKYPEALPKVRTEISALHAPEAAEAIYQMAGGAAAARATK